VVSNDSLRLSLDVRTEKAGRLVMHFECHAEAPHTLQGVLFEATDDRGGGPGGPGGRAPEEAGPPLTDEQIVARLAAELDSLSRIDRFSGVALLDKGGRTLLARAYGMASREDKRPNTMETRFHLASIGKQFTSVAIRQLAAAGKLSLDDPVTKHLTDYRVANAAKITIRMLLDHRAGVADVLDSPEVWKEPLKYRTASDWYRAIRERPLEFEPGARSRYSNGGYAVLGMVIERVSGEDYYDYIRRHVYAPAGMTRTDSYFGDALPPDVAVGYTRDPDGRRAPPAPDSGEPEAVTVRLGRGSAAGGGYSTAADLLRYANALRSGKLLGAKGGDGGMDAGSGLGVAGGSPGTNTLLEIQGPYTLVLLANQDPPVAERFAETTGRQLARAARPVGKSAPVIERVGGGRR
jgi:CubicO group peptidase (beta-lactamase class C family)